MKSLIIICSVILFGMNAEAKTIEPECCNNDLTYSECTAKCSSSECCNITSAAGVVDEDLKCMVSGETISDEGTEFSYLGIEYKFCCDGCVSQFKSEPIK